MLLVIFETSGDVEAAESRDLNVRLALANQGGQWLRRRQAVGITTPSGFDFSRNFFWGSCSTLLLPSSFFVRIGGVPLDGTARPSCLYSSHRWHTRVITKLQ